ncbi:MAG: TVP38/TMEM64 family protein [Eggerthellaceae bacterium]|jgi:uncharacterized membrane protein YdjX (TVP38/TMEM64 family)
MADFEPDSLDSDSANAGYQVKPEVPGSDAEVRAERRALRENLKERREDIAAHDYRFTEKSKERIAQEPPSQLQRGDRQVGKRGLTVADIVKLVGLLAVLVLLALIVWAMWPTLSGLFEEGGVEALVEKVQNAGPMGVAMLLGLQLLQVIVAFIPGEVVQVAAGMMYGAWWGGLIVTVGACLASAAVYSLVHWLGAPFVRDMVSDSFSDRFRRFEASGHLDTIVFILFLIPGMPKDVFTYVVALTDMKLGSFLILTTFARMPGIFLSTYAASSLANGDMTKSIVIFVILVVLALVCIVLRDRIIERLDGFRRK